MAETKKTLFTKADFLTAAKYAKKYNVAKDKVLELMTKLYRNRVTIPGDGQERCIIARNGSTSNVGSRYTIHPLGLAEFNRRLDLELAKEK